MIVINCEWFLFFKQKTAYDTEYGLVGSEMCIRDSLWGTEQDATQAWKDLHTNYSAIGKSTPEADANTNDVTTLIPLLSDLLEAKDRQLLNHCSRVSFYASLLALSLIHI